MLIFSSTCCSVIPPSKLASASSVYSLAEFKVLASPVLTASSVYSLAASKVLVLPVLTTSSVYDLAELKVLASPVLTNSFVSSLVYILSNSSCNVLSVSCTNTELVVT